MTQKAFDELALTNRRNDHRYFTMIPNVIWFFNLTLADFKLYNTIVKTTGADGQTECYKSTETLTKESGLSAGAISKSKANLERVGLIERYSKKRTKGGRPIDHLVLVDIWEENVLFFKRVYSSSEKTPLVSSLNELRSLVYSLGEPMGSPSETEEEPLNKNQKEQQQEPKRGKNVVVSSQPSLTPEQAAQYQEQYQGIKTKTAAQKRQAAYLSLTSAGVSEEAALRFAKEIDLDRILQVCAVADVKESITDKPGWIVSALKEGWEVKVSSPAAGPYQNVREL